MDGTHVPSDGSMLTSLAWAEQLDCTAIQVMFHSARRYLRSSPLTQLEIDSYLAAAEGQLNVTNHASYFCGITNPLDDMRSTNAMRSLVEDLENAELCGFENVVVHAGRMRSDEDVQNAILFLRDLDRRTPDRKSKLVLETMVSGFHADPRFLAKLIDDAAVPNLGICLDTAHLYGAGYDMSQAVTCDELLTDRSVADKVAVVHFNNSHFGVGSGRDRHSALKEGVMAKEEIEVMHNLLREHLGEKIPFVVEATQDYDEIEAMKQWTADYLKSKAVMA